MKKRIIFGLGICSIVALIGCSKQKKEEEKNNYEVIETVSQPNDSMMIINGIIAEPTGPNSLSIISMEGDTIWFTNNGAVVEGSGIFIGDSAVVYYIYNDEIPYTSPLEAKKIVTKKAIQRAANMQKNNKK